MNRSSVVDAIASSASLTKSQAYDALQAFTSIVVNQVVHDQPVFIEGFGMFVAADKGNGQRYLQFRQHKYLMAELNPSKPIFKELPNAKAAG